MKSRTITGTMGVTSEESTVGRMFRTRRMLKQIGVQYGLTISAGSMTGMLKAGSTVLATHTITGIEQAETVPEKWDRALATVSAEYGLGCTWEEEVVTDGGERRESPSLTMTMEGSADGVSWHSLPAPTPKSAEAMEKMGIQFPCHGSEISVSPDELVVGFPTPLPKSYADTPTGTRRFDSVVGAAMRRGITNYGPHKRDFAQSLHLTGQGDEGMDLHCPCCGTTDNLPCFYANNLEELLAGNYDTDEPEIDQMKAGITCKCGVRSTYNFDDQTIKLDLVAK